MCTCSRDWLSCVRTGLKPNITILYICGTPGITKQISKDRIQKQKPYSYISMSCSLSIRYHMVIYMTNGNSIQGCRDAGLLCANINTQTETRSLVISEMVFCYTCR